jgi:hypothetical protein
MQVVLHYTQRVRSRRGGGCDGGSRKLAKVEEKKKCEKVAIVGRKKFFVLYFGPHNCTLAHFVHRHHVRLVKIFHLSYYMRDLAERFQSYGLFKKSKMAAKNLKCKISGLC